METFRAYAAGLLIGGALVALCPRALEDARRLRRDLEVRALERRLDSADPIGGPL